MGVRSKKKEAARRRLRYFNFGVELFVGSDLGRGSWRRLEALRVIFDECLLTTVPVRRVEVEVQHLLIRLI